LEQTKTLIIPCKDEGREFSNILKRFLDYLDETTLVLIVVDDIEDSSLEYLGELSSNIKVLVNTYGPGPALAIKYGIDNSVGNSICVAMGDGSDDPKQVEELFLLIDRGLSVAVASRYTKNGKYIGRKSFKYFLSKYSGIILNILFRLGTNDPTNMFKAYSSNFLKNVKVESKNGFTLGLEMVVKAKLNNAPIGEMPTIWIDRTHGISKFNMKKYLPSYIYWVKRLILRQT
jgi:hypothetical protein